MVLLVCILICLFLWWLASQGTNAHTPTQRQQEQSPTAYQQPESPKSTYSSRPAYGPSNSREPNVLRRPVGECICGCNGVPLTHLPAYSIDYEKYKVCPARNRRKSTGKYTDDQGNPAEWNSSSFRRRRESQSRKAAEKRERDEASRQRKIAEERQRALARQTKEEQEKLRHASGEPALSPAEALRRGLDTYIGKQCAVGHRGERHARNGECVECRRIDQVKRAAMRRGAYPRDLTPSERRRIGQIYAEARRLTKETGIEHHVDHIKPLAAGGEHHPDNLRVITAEENLKKGANWNGVNHATTQIDPSGESQ